MKIKPPTSDLFYVTIDGTRAIDSVALGNLWQKFGWKNLLLDLKKGTSNPPRRVDAGHPNLPIRFADETQDFSSGPGTRFADVVMMPEGMDGTGLDTGNWPGPKAADNAVQISAANGFVQSFILSPCADPKTSTLGAGPHVADLVYVSSHGVRTGDMFGEASDTIDEVLPFFILANAADTKQKFADGVKWLILSNCNTMVDETHNDWLTLMNASPSFRGILGYHGTSVAADASSAANVSFVKLLESGKSLREAWQVANTKHHMADRWVVICHDAAKNDTIVDWNQGFTPVPLKPPVIKLFDDANQGGIAVVNHPDPFPVLWSTTVGGTTNIVTPANRYDAANKIKDGSEISITVGASAVKGKFDVGTTIDVTLIFIREDYEEPIDLGKMFTITGVTNADPAVKTVHRNDDRVINKKIDPGSDTWVMTVTKRAAAVRLDLKVTKLFLGKTHHNLPFWLKAEYTAPDKSGPARFDFIRNAAIYAS